MIITLPETSQVHEVVALATVGASPWLGDTDSLALGIRSSYMDGGNDAPLNKLGEGSSSSRKTLSNRNGARLPIQTLESGGRRNTCATILR